MATEVETVVQDQRKYEKKIHTTRIDREKNLDTAKNWIFWVGEKYHNWVVPPPIIVPIKGNYWMGPQKPNNHAHPGINLL